MNITVQQLKKQGHGLARQLFIMWLAVGCLWSRSICSSSTSCEPYSSHSLQEQSITDT